MEVIGALFDGIFVALEPINLGLAIIGVVVGLFVGAMPGLGSVNGVAILLPFTFVIQNFTGGATSPMIFLAAVYYGAMYGGAISSIALGIPGASTAVATTFDGRPLALKGKAHVALMTAAIASFIGATVANLLFTGFAPLLASVALSAVGFDIISGEPRLIFFDIQGFSHGIRFLVLAIGIYGIGEMLWTINASRNKTTMTSVEINFQSITAALFRFKEAWKGTAIGSFLGFFIGILPAAGATPASLMGYGITKMASRTPEQFGKGALDGVAAPEAANNSASTGAMLPMMTLGIPGSPTTAVLLAGMVIWGLDPGPLLFSEQPDFVWPLIGSFYISNLVALLVNLAFIPIFLWMLRMPFTILSPIIFVLSLVGTYAAYMNMFDVWLMVLVGFGGFFMRMLDYPVAPAVLAIVLGPIAEPALRQTLMQYETFTIFVTRPIAAPITIIAIILILLPGLKLILKKITK